MTGARSLAAEATSPSNAPRRVLVVGIARTGVAVARQLTAEGWEVIAGDDSAVAERDRVEMERLSVEVLVQPDWAQLVGEVDLVVPSPGVPPAHPSLAIARGADTEIRSEIDLAAERCRVPFAAVTGTNGKSTVTTLAAYMLRESGLRCEAVGNLGSPFLESVDASVDVLCVEVSSFQLAWTTPRFRPAAAVVLAIAPDHIDWHGTFAKYVEAKARIVSAQERSDVCVYDASDPAARHVAARAASQRVGIGSPNGYRVEGDELLAPSGAFTTVSALRRALPHDLTNALAASAAAVHLGATFDGVRAALKDFEGLPHRVSLVGDAGGVQYYDDSKATNPHAALHAVRAFDSVVLIAGGRNKGLDLAALTEASDHLRAVVAIGEAGPEVVAAFAGVRPVEVQSTMRGAVRAACRLASPGDVVLLAPGCASFDAYSSYAERGDDFTAEVRRMLERGDDS